MFDDVVPMIRAEDNGFTGADQQSRLVRNEELYGPDPVVEVQVHEPHTLIGGCHPSLWEIGGNRVVDVLYSNGEDCPTGTDPEDNVRILVLEDPEDIAAERQGRYIPRTLPLFSSAFNRMKDGAGNFAEETAFDVIPWILPPPPDLISALRHGIGKTAPLDEGTYWTRFGGNDLEPTISGVRIGRFVQVLDESRNVLRTEQSDGSGNYDIIVPIGDIADGQQTTFER